MVAGLNIHALNGEKILKSINLKPRNIIPYLWVILPRTSKIKSMIWKNLKFRFYCT
jgi:hypothetical protein